MSLTKYGVDYDRAARMNSSLMGPAGYDYIYQSEEFLPYEEFCSFDDKWGTKKSLTTWDKPVVNQMSVEEYGEGAIKVAQHYKFNVGTSYAICSQMIFATANQLYKNNECEAYDTMVKATVLAWRGLYEGLGLSGYSVKAQEVFGILTFAAYSHVDCKINRKANGEYIFGFVVEEGTEQGVDAIALLQNHFGEHVGRDVLQRVIRSRATCITYRKIETKGSSAISKKSALRELIPAAIVSGCLRRLGQGNDPVEVAEAMEAVDDEPISESVINLFHQEGFGSMLANSVLSQVSTVGARLHGAVGSELAARAQADQMGM